VKLITNFTHSYYSHCIKMSSKKQRRTECTNNGDLCRVDVVSLGPLLSQIVVALSPLITSNSSTDKSSQADQTDLHVSTVTEIFEFLIIQNKSE